MNWKKYMWTIALFMSYLIIMIPIYSSSVLADGAVKIISVSGEDGVNDYAKIYDYVNLSAWVTGVDNVTPNMVLVNDAPFNTCSPNPMKGYTCNYLTPYMEISDSDSGFTVNLKNGGSVSGNLYVDNQSPIVTIDPLIQTQNKSITVNYKVSHPGHCPGITKAEFKVSEQVVNSTKLQIPSSPAGCNIPDTPATFAYSDTGNKTVCVDVYDALGHMGEACQMSYIDTTPPTVSDVQIVRSPEVCKVDYSLNDKKDRCVSAKGMVACPLGEELNTSDGTCQYDAAETELDYVSAEPEKVWVRAVIDEHKWETSPNVKADLSDLIDVPAYKETLKNVPADTLSSSSKDGVFVWPLMLSVFSGGERKVVFSGKDAAGNTFNETKTVMLKYDTTPPEIISIASDKCRERCANGNSSDCSNVCYVGPGWNKAIINIKETESGLDFNNIFLDLGAFSEVYKGQQMRVTECTPGWTCDAWFQVGQENINAIEEDLKSMSPEEQAALDALKRARESTNLISKVLLTTIAIFLRPAYTSPTATGTALPISVVIPSQDDAGNLIKGNEKAAFVLDKDAPSSEAKNITIKSVTDLGEVDFHQSGDMLHIIANVSDYTPVTAVADFSNIMGGASAEKGDCNYDDTTQKAVCEWNVGPILNGYKKTTMNFNFTDFVGNTKVVAKDIEILATGKESSHLWRLAVGGTISSSNYVERRTALVMPEYPVYFSVPLIGDTDAKMVSLSVKNCVSNISTGEQAKYYVTGMDPELVNNYAYGLNTVPGTSVSTEGGNVPAVALKYTISTSQPMPRASIVMNCRMHIISKWKGTITPPEDVNVSLEIKFYDSTFGPIEDEALKKMNSMYNEISGSGWDFVNRMKQIIAVLSALCKIGTMIVSAINVLQNAEHMFSAACYASGACRLATGDTAPKIACTVAGTASWLAEYPVWQKILDWPCKVSSCRMIEAIPGFDKIYDTFVLGSIDKVLSTPLGAALSGYTAYKSFMTQTGQDINAKPASSFYTDLKTQNSGANVIEMLADNSVVWATATLCLPGIIKHVENARQIKCKRYYCYETIPSTGVPMMTCDEIYHYDECRFITGEIFNIIPWFQLLNMMSGLVKKALANAGAAIMIVGGLYCSLSCTKDDIGNFKAWACDILDMANTITELTKDVQGIASAPARFFTSKDFCDEITPFDKFLKEQTGGTNSTAAG